MFVAFDGLDGAGKTTQIHALADWFRKQNQKVTVINFGDAPPFEEVLRKINEQGPPIPAQIRELIYYFEGLFTTLNVIEPRRMKEVVLIDRYYLTYRAYGPLNGWSRDDVLYFTRNLTEPDYYFVLDIRPEDAVERISRDREFTVSEVGYGAATRDPAQRHTRSRFVEFQSKVRANFLAEIGERHYLLDATTRPDELHRQIVEMLRV